MNRESAIVSPLGIKNQIYGNIAAAPVEKAAETIKPLYGKDLTMMLVEPKPQVNIRDYKEQEYLDMLLGDEEQLNVEFVQELPKIYETSTYEYNKELESLESSEKIINQEILDLENRLNALSMPEQDVSQKELATLTEKFASMFPKIKYETDSVASDSEDEAIKIFMKTESSPADKEEKKKTTHNWVPGLKKLSTLAWLAKRRKKGFVASRNLRKSLLAKNVDLSGEEKAPSIQEAFEANKGAFMAKRNLREELKKQGMRFLEDTEETAVEEEVPPMDWAFKASRNLRADLKKKL